MLVEEGWESICRQCTQQEVETEKHFLLQCGYVAEEREVLDR